MNTLEKSLTLAKAWLDSVDDKTFYSEYEKIKDLESENRCYRYANEKLTEELSKAKEDIETLKYQKAILSGKVAPQYQTPW